MSSSHRNTCNENQSKSFLNHLKRTGCIYKLWKNGPKATGLIKVDRTTKLDRWATVLPC